MAGNLKKSKVKKRSQRAIQMAEQRKQEEIKEQEKKEAVIQKKKNYNKNALDTMFPLYGLICAVLSVLFNQIGIFSVGACLLGYFGIKRNTDRKDRFYYIACIDVTIGLLTALLFVLYISGIISH